MSADEVLRVALGGAKVDEVAPLGGGRSGARLFVVRSGGRAYVLRLPQTDRADHAARAEREVVCARLASSRGIGPELVWADEASGATLMAKVEDVLVGPARASAPGRRERLAGALRTLHEGPALPGAGSVEEILAHFEGSLAARGTPLSAPLAGVLRAALAAKKPSERRTPCHNDLNPGNVLETSERILFVDWETAGEGDPFVDLAQLTVFSLMPAEGRSALLEAYLGRAPTEAERRHAALARVVAAGFYAASFRLMAEGEAAPLPMGELLPRLAQGAAGPAEIAASLGEIAVSEGRALL